MKAQKICFIALLVVSLALIAYGVSLFDARFSPLVVGALLWFNLTRSGQEG